MSIAEPLTDELTEAQQAIFACIGKKDLNGFKQAIGQLVGGPNFVEKGGLTPLQHACFMGNKEAVQILLDMGADVHFNKHGGDYTPLHFAALSGNIKICRLLLDAGINPNSVNSVYRTASQMAAFVGNHACVEAINNYVPRSVLEHYTKPHGQQTEPLIPPAKLDAFHSFVIETNLHPVRITLNVQSLGLIKEMNGMRKALQLISEKEMKKYSGVNETMALKFHYLAWILGQLIRCQEQCATQQKSKSSAGDAPNNKNDFIEIFIKRVLKENKDGQLEYLEFTIRECIRDFTECTLFRQAMEQLASSDPPSALTILRTAINGRRAFMDHVPYCSTCGNEKPEKKCSQCKSEQYCDRECQRLHWFMHKKNCKAGSSNNAAATTPATTTAPIDSRELEQALTNLSTTKP